MMEERFDTGEPAANHAAGSPDRDQPVSHRVSDPPSPPGIPNVPYGIIRGVVRARSGQPVAWCSVSPSPTSSPHPPVADVAALTGADGSYVLKLPPATYTITANGTIGSGRPVWGEHRHIEVINAQSVIVEITVEQV